MKFFHTFLISILCNNLFAQDIKPDSLLHFEKRFSFAKMYVGLEGISTTGGNTTILANSNTFENKSFKGYFFPRLIWGATHFWGHSDIYVAFPLSSYNKTAPLGISNLNYNLGVETGVKIYPFKLIENTIRPYFGMAWNISGFQQTQTGTGTSIILTQNTTPVLVGLSYQAKKFIFETGLQYFFDNKYNYPVSRTINGNLTLPEFAYNFSLKYLMETTYQNTNLIKKKIKVLEKNIGFNAFYFGLGPSASIGIPTFSEYDESKYPFFKNHKRYIGIIPEFTAGYYFSKPNINIGISYRKMSDSYEGFNVQHVHERKSTMIEAYKFLGDYHGFNPFIGLTTSFEKLFFATRDGNINKDWSKYYDEKLAVGIILGWDIKPTKAESWLLRTNLRYSPLNMKVENKNVAFDYIEFNFIQLVLFPERILAQRKSPK